MASADWSVHSYSRAKAIKKICWLARAKCGYRIRCLAFSAVQRMCRNHLFDITQLRQTGLRSNAQPFDGSLVGVVEYTPISQPYTVPTIKFSLLYFLCRVSFYFLMISTVSPTGYHSVFRISTFKNFRPLSSLILLFYCTFGTVCNVTLPIWYFSIIPTPDTDGFS